MKSPTRFDQRRHRRRPLHTLAVTAAAMYRPGDRPPHQRHKAATAAKGSVVAVLDGPFGPMLIAGSGQSAGTALYAITSDTATSFGCSTTKSVQGMPYVCTGPSGGHNGLAGFHDDGHAGGRARVSQSMLGEVSRAGIGEQVTYNGHPLYLFDSVPGLPGGEAYDEPSIPAGPRGLVAPLAERCLRRLGGDAHDGHDQRQEGACRGNHRWWGGPHRPGVQLL